MTDNEQRFLLRGMSIARVILLKAECPHHAVAVVRAYQQILAQAWNLIETADDVQSTISEINEITWQYLMSHPEMTNGQPVTPTLKH
jgi:hypothetical protein